MEKKELNREVMETVAGGGSSAYKYVFTVGETIWMYNQIRYIRVSQDVQTNDDYYPISVSIVTPETQMGPHEQGITMSAIVVQSYLDSFGRRS